MKEGTLEHLVATHSTKKEKAKQYSRQLTYSLALVSLIFFGTILSYHATEVNVNGITGMAVAVENSGTAASVSNNWHDLTGFVWAVKTSPQLPQIKLFFYTMWILIVLVGQAIWFEYQER
ncbi:hypothetical protein HZA99_00720 [Candidatus Woesearchaeota archaeon]|nr:hypothetical protein [Candidatus Woesearchaeota archaeon]